MGRNAFGMNQEKLLIQNISQSFFVVFQPKPERTNLPNISLHSCSLPKLKEILVASKYYGKHPFSSSDGTEHIKLIDNTSV
jgi:hypothetical protein